MDPIELLGLIGEVEGERRFQEAFYDLADPLGERFQAVMNVTARHNLWGLRSRIKERMFALVYGYNPFRR